MLKEPRIRRGESREAARRKREAFWRRVLEEQANSGVTVADFCERHLLSKTKYYWWKRQLRSKRGKPLDARPSERAPSFVPVTVRPQPASGGPQYPFEVQLCGMRVLRVSGDFDGESLRRLLAVLEDAGPC